MVSFRVTNEFMCWLDRRREGVGDEHVRATGFLLSAQAAELHECRACEVAREGGVDFLLNGLARGNVRCRRGVIYTPDRNGFIELLAPNMEPSSLTFHVRRRE